MHTLTLAKDFSKSAKNRVSFWADWTPHFSVRIDVNIPKFIENISTKLSPYGPGENIQKITQVKIDDTHIYKLWKCFQWIM